MNQHEAPRSPETHQDDWSLNTRLVEQFRSDSFDSRSRRLTVFCAPLGYGKIPTARSWLHHDATSVHWIRLAPQSDLWGELSRGLRLFTIPTEDSGHSDDALDTVRRLASQLTAPLTLVITHYQHATNHDNDLHLAELSSTHSLLSVVIIARRVELLDQRIIPAHTRVRLVGPAELTLTSAETRQLPSKFQLPHIPRVAEALARTDGWPLAITAALQLGDDNLYETTSTGRVWRQEAPAQSFDPIENLSDFALDMFELLDPVSRKVLLAVAQLHAIRDASMATVLDVSQKDAEASIKQLLAHGLVLAQRTDGSTYYRVHRSVQPVLYEHALRTIDFAQRRQIYVAYADDVRHSAPVTAFRFYIESEAFASAELVLAHHLNLITDETDMATALLRSLPEQALINHPTFTAALVVLEITDPETPRSTLQRLFELWQQGLTERQPGVDGDTPAELKLPYLLQAVVLARLTGQLDQSMALLKRLDQTIVPSDLAGKPDSNVYTPMRTVVSYVDSMPTYLLESAQTALAVGDFALARHRLEKLKRHSQLKISRPQRDFRLTSTRTVTDAESGTRWLLAALGTLAYLHIFDGDVRTSLTLLKEHDDLAAGSGIEAAALSVLDREIARAHLSYELRDPSLLTQALTALEPYKSRLDRAYLLSAEAEAVRTTHGPAAGLAHLQAARQEHPDTPSLQDSWSEQLAGLEAAYSTSLGYLGHTEKILESGQLTPETEQIERLRLALYSGDDLSAMADAQQIAGSGFNTWNRISRLLILAVAAWNCGQHAQAFDAIHSAASEVDRYQVYSILLGVPFAELRAVTVAARDDAQPHDPALSHLLELLDTVPQPARTRRYERLTDAELRALTAIATHRNATQAADELFLTTGTIKKHLTAVNRKLGTKSRDEAILQARAMRLISSDALKH